MSKMLLDEKPLIVLPSLAKAIGVNPAIVLQQIHYWLQEKKHFYDGSYWTYNTYDSWSEQFQHLTPRGVRSILDKLEKIGLVESNNYNKSGYNHTKWYTINYNVLNGFRPKEQIDVSISDTSERQSVTHLINTENNTENTITSNDVRDKIDFDLFWDNYDKKVGHKNKIKRKWDRLRESTQLIILKHIELYKKAQPNKRYRKNPETYLNNESWNDEIIEENNGIYTKHLTEDKLRAIANDIANDPDLK